MSTKMGFWRWALASAALTMLCGSASARLINDPPSVTTNDPAAIVIYPKIKVDTDLCQRNGVCSVSGKTCTFVPGSVSGNDAACPNAGIDTLVQLTNTSEFLTRVKCFYVNANSHCSNDTGTICTQENFRETCPAGGRCVDNWTENDFVLTLTKRQPLSWSASNGLTGGLPLSNTPGQGDPPQFNDGTISPVQENPFRGELRCIQLDVATELPTDRNDLKGEATVVTTVEDLVDARKYNAIGITAIEGAQDGEPTTLNIGGPNAEYHGCPNILTLNNFFEGAEVTTHAETLEGPVRSQVTFVPCGADFINQEQNLETAVLQFLIYNEFEQRFSTSTRVTCFKQTRLADIDTRPGEDGNEFSIFAAGVQGTLTGQTRIRAVSGPDVDGYDANGVIAILDEFWGRGTCSSPGTGGGSGGGKYPKVEELCATDADCATGQECSVTGNVAGSASTASNIQFQGTRTQGDRMFIPIP